MTICFAEIVAKKKGGNNEIWRVGVKVTTLGFDPRVRGSSPLPATKVSANSRTRFVR